MKLTVSHIVQLSSVRVCAAVTVKLFVLIQWQLTGFGITSMGSENHRMTKRDNPTSLNLPSAQQPLRPWQPIPQPCSISCSRPGQPISQSCDKDSCLLVLHANHVNFKVMTCVTIHSTYTLTWTLNWVYEDLICYTALLLLLLNTVVVRDLFASLISLCLLALICTAQSFFSFRC